jgi:hypothetical protein
MVNSQESEPGEEQANPYVRSGLRDKVTHVSERTMSRAYISLFRDLLSHSEELFALKLSVSVHGGRGNCFNNCWMEHRCVSNITCFHPFLEAFLANITEQEIECQRPKVKERLPWIVFVVL